MKTRRNSLTQIAGPLLILVAIAAQATSLARLSLEQLTAAAQVVVHARCLSNQTQWDRGEIWTLTRFELVESLKGAAPQQITVRLIGGQVGHLRSIVSAVPRFRPGEEVILFLESSGAGKFSVTAWSEGAFRVRREPRTGVQLVTQASSEQAAFDPATRQFRPAGIRDMPLEHFLKRVADAERQGANPE